MLVILVGKTCSGKTTLRQEFQKSGYCTIEASEWFSRCKQEYHIAGEFNCAVPLNIYMSSKIIEEFGNRLNHTLLTGLRSLNEYEYFCKYGFNVILIAILCNDRESYIRSKRRKRDFTGGYTEFLANRIQPDMALGLDRLIQKADITIENQGISRKDFLRKGMLLIEPYINK